jgi:transcriptional regulator with XRE-family HTH domain
LTFEKIKDLREKEELTQSEVAAYLKCTQACYSYYERGTRDIPTEVLCQLADLYHTSTDYLLGRTNNPRPYTRSKK